MNALMTVMMMWLVANFDLPPTAVAPRVEFVSPSAMVSLRYGKLGVRALDNQAAPDAALADTLAIYNEDTQAIYLRDSWTGNSAAELSVLLHEMVHHLQAVGKLKFECPQEREMIAYKAQEQWLRLFGLTLQSEFGLDPMSILVKSKCLF